MIRPTLCQLRADILEAASVM